MNKSREHAGLLLQKSAEDQYALERLIGDLDAPDAVIGFHAQQAAEKLLKAVLTSRSIRYGRRRDLDRLVDQAMRQEPYSLAKRVFWVVDNGSSHRGDSCVARLQQAWPNIVVAHLPIHVCRPTKRLDSE
jgi:HEPN domain-containing protein